MKYVLLALAVLTVLVTVTPAYADTVITLDTLVREDTITVFGHVSPIADNSVLLTFHYNGQQVDSEKIAINQSSGEFIQEFPIQNPTVEDYGIYTAKITYLGKSVETTFELVEPTLEPTPEPVIPTNSTTPEPAPINATAPSYAELLAENQLLKDKIENLKQLVLEQLKVIVQWING